MPFNELQRRDSWPPTILRIRDDDEVDAPGEAIDENPFSYFLTSPEDLDNAVDIDTALEDLSAGIEPADEPRHKRDVRAVAPSTLQRDSSSSSSHAHALGLGISAIPLSLRDFTLIHHTSHSNPPARKMNLSVSLTPSPSSRGRSSTRGRRRGRTRSLSAPRRPHAWREPSPDVWSIPEERESGSDEGEGAEAKGKTTREESAVKEDKGREREVNREEDKVKLSPVKKLKKRVHWAL